MDNMTKQKRDRQPNWSTEEKELLVKLVKKYQPILSSRSNKKISLTEKMAAWEDVAMQMKNAGYKRPIDRLRQQLGRMRSADDKYKQIEPPSPPQEDLIHEITCTPNTSDLIGDFNQIDNTKSYPDSDSSFGSNDNLFNKAPIAVLENRNCDFEFNANTQNNEEYRKILISEKRFKIELNKSIAKQCRLEQKLLQLKIRQTKERLAMIRFQKRMDLVMYRKNIKLKNLQIQALRQKINCEQSENETTPESM